MCPEWASEGPFFQLAPAVRLHACTQCFLDVCMDIIMKHKQILEFIDGIYIYYIYKFWDPAHNIIITIIQITANILSRCVKLTSHVTSIIDRGAH